MSFLKSGQRRYLRQQAHHLKPTVQIGKNGVTEMVMEAVDEALDQHELIKVKFNEGQDDKRILAEQIAEETRSDLVQIIGNIIVLFRYQHDPSRRKISLPREDEE